MNPLRLFPIDNLLPTLPRARYSPHTVPPSPSDTCSSSDPDPDPPLPLHVVCNVPLLAPRPLPYHSPTFLQFDLPDTDEDLSHPPYTHRPSKRKRDKDDDPVHPHPQPKRRPGTHRWRSLRPWDHPSSPNLSHRSGNHRPRA